MSKNKPYTLKFMLDYGTNCLWASDEKTENAFGYHIEDVEKIGISDHTLGFSEFVYDLYDLRLNPIYPTLPSFWSGEMCVYFQQKVHELYAKIVVDIGDAFEIIISESAQQEMSTVLNIETINSELKMFVENPVEYFIAHNIHFNDPKELMNEIQVEYAKWKEQEKKILHKQKP